MLHQAPLRVCSPPTSDRYTYIFPYASYFTLTQVCIRIRIHFTLRASRLSSIRARASERVEQPFPNAMHTPRASEQVEQPFRAPCTMAPRTERAAQRYETRPEIETTSVSILAQVFKSVFDFGACFAPKIENHPCVLAMIARCTARCAQPPRDSHPHRTPPHPTPFVGLLSNLSVPAPVAGPSLAQVWPKSAQVWPKSAQVVLKSAQVCAKVAPNWRKSAPLGETWGDLGGIAADLGQTWADLGRLGQTWADLNPTWADLGQTWARLGQTWARLGPDLGQT